MTVQPGDSDITSPAWEAFAAGWAITGAPATPRLPHAATAAAATARDHATDPRILEVTFQLGQLEGTWAIVFQRRETVIQAHTAAVRREFLTMARDLTAGTVIRRLRAELGMPPEAGPGQQAPASSAAAGLLAGLYIHPRYRVLQDLVAAALQAAMAEGQAGALAVAAQQQHISVSENQGNDGSGGSFSLAAAYRRLYRMLAHLGDLPDLAQQWIQRMIMGAARDIGGLLARLAAAGASQQEMVTALEDALTSPDGAAAASVTSFLDLAMSQAMSVAALNLYQAEGLATVNFLTAGDASVCVYCQSAEDDNPYPVSDAPVPALHPNCRCTLVPADPAPFQSLTGFLTTSDED